MPHDIMHYWKSPDRTSLALPGGLCKPTTHSVYEQLGLGELKPIQVTLHLPNRSVKRPRGIVEDVWVQIEKFYEELEKMTSSR